MYKIAGGVLTPFYKGFRSQKIIYKDKKVEYIILRLKNGLKVKILGVEGAYSQDRGHIS